MRRGARALIDLDALRHNLSRVRAAAPHSRIAAAVKADGYGHGLLRIASALGEVDALAVACIGEAERLRHDGSQARVLLLQGVRDRDELQAAAELGVDLVVHHEHQLRLLETTQLPQPVRVWLKLDTGMHRLGLEPQEVRPALNRLEACKGVQRSVRFLTHLACADDRDDITTRAQIGCFDQAVAGLEGEQSLANSAGVMGWPASHRDWVRPGIMLYGASPFADGDPASEGLEPVMTLTAPVIAVRRCRAGERIGYGGTWICPEDMPIGVVGIGYGDGYPRHAPSGTPALVNGRLAPVVGRVSMDMLTLDLRAVGEVAIGDEAVLWGRGLGVDRVAAAAATISYELLCAVGSRVPVEVVG